jgi:TRAP-type mannitol/chloroaromatic compound transport system substrate-binding protein
METNKKETPKLKRNEISEGDAALDVLSNKNITNIIKKQSRLALRIRSKIANEQMNEKLKALDELLTPKQEKESAALKAIKQHLHKRKLQVKSRVGKKTHKSNHSPQNER